jgi:hypothetical protein
VLVEKSFTRLGRVAREGLLDEHGLAGRDRQQRLRVVGGVGGSDVHGVHLPVRDQLLVGPVRTLDAEPCGERVGVRLGAGPTATIRCDDLCSARAMLVAIPPGARTPQRNGGASYGSGIRDVGRSVIMTGRLQRGYHSDLSLPMARGRKNSRGPRSYGKGLSG